MAVWLGLSVSVAVLGWVLLTRTRTPPLTPPIHFPVEYERKVDRQLTRLLESVKGGEWKP